MRFKNSISLFALITLASSSLLAGNKPAYDSSKDIGTNAPAGADVLFDGTQASVDKNWRMWPKSEMPITWKLVKSHDSDEMVLMTDGGKSWGTHDIVSIKEYTDFEGHVEFDARRARR